MYVRDIRQTYSTSVLANTGYVSDRSIAIPCPSLPLPDLWGFVFGVIDFIKMQENSLGRALERPSALAGTDKIII